MPENQRHCAFPGQTTGLSCAKQGILLVIQEKTTTVPSCKRKNVAFFLFKNTVYFATSRSTRICDSSTKSTPFLISFLIDRT